MISVDRPALTKTIWVTREGERIPVRNLGDNHLVNIIRMLRRVATNELEFEIADAYGFMSSLHGEMAIYAMEGSISQLEDITIDDFISNKVPTWNALVAEADRRKLVTE